MTQHRMDCARFFNRSLGIPQRESRNDGEKVYRCDGLFCPGLPYSPPKVPHPRSCRVPFEGAD